MDYVILPNSELRAHARQQLQGVWGQMALVFFILFLISLPYNIASILNSMGTLTLDIPSFFAITMLLGIITIVISGPLYLGLVGYLLKRVRAQEIAIENIFDGFKRFFPSFLLLFFSGLFVFLWSLLFIIPGIIKIFSYSMAFFIMYDNPDIKPLAALKKSQIMMKGYKWKLFLLVLSFIGWILLGLLTLCIGYFWLYPYIWLSQANFYENLRIGQEKGFI